jgi:alkanesulfonate monooxygenase SsuD/methylene tetrahydromethanopterin reductase-like flavin-dependent oxidoreductase (luciferase family)
VGGVWLRFPPTRERLDTLRDHLEVITRMLAPGRATYEGEHARVAGAINVPKPLQQPRPPIMVGGNGPEVTWRLAARFADELNLDGLHPSEVAEAMPVIRDRCQEIGRDPATLRVSVHIWSERLVRARSQPELLAAYREAGVHRVQALVRRAATDLDALDRFAEAALAGGAELEPAEPVGAQAGVGLG